MKNYIIILIAVALFTACEKETTVTNPPAENNTTIVNPSPAKTEKTETNTTINNAAPVPNTETETKTETKTTSSPNP